MKAVIRQRALELGFDGCSFTTAAAPASAKQFENWVTSGQHGEMTWLERSVPKRTDPQKILPGARSIIMLAATYGLNNSQSTTRNLQAGIIARYACFDDYHDVLGKRLNELARFINQLGGSETRSSWHVDAGPLLERDFAQRSGLGFVGKHTNLVSRKFGNWILLGGIVTTLEMEPDLPEKNHCGKCARCIEVCPTRAISAPFQLDARLCISYLTIELKGSIPVELRPVIGNRIFGCDDCLAVCPWNRFACEGKLMKSYTRPELTEPDLIELLQLDEAGFRTRFAGTPILRAKRRGLLRNVCVALGNIGDSFTLPYLEKVAKDPEPLIAEHAKWAIEWITIRCCRR